MPVIKGYTASGMTREAIVLDLGDLGRQAARLQAAAESKARKIIADAEQEAARLIEEARTKGLMEGRNEGVQRGIKEGREQGHKEALQQMTPQLQQLHEAWTLTLHEWQGQREAIEREARQSIVDISLVVAEKLVNRIIEVDASVIVDQVDQALSFILQPMDVMVKISPRDRAALDEALPQLRGEFAHLKNIILVEDAGLSPGGCVVTYGQGQIDASIETQLRRLVELMLPGQPLFNAETAVAVDGSESGTGGETSAGSSPPQPGESTSFPDPKA